MTEHRGRAIRFAAGAIGEPGDRTFLLQFETEETLDTYLLEKGQVAALGEQSIDLLNRIGFTGAGSEVDTSLLRPESLVFRVGEMQLGYSEDSGIVTLVLGSVDETEVDIAYDLTPAMLDAAARSGLETVAAGRPTCPRCGLAMDPDGHHCPSNNGDLREHQP